MNQEELTDAIRKKITVLTGNDPTLFVVDVRIKPVHNVRVYIDGDQGVSIEQLAMLNRKLYKEIEASGFFPGDDFSLEVSSPGVDEPLKLHRQYRKNIGRAAEVQELDGGKKIGKLVTVTDSEIILEVTKGKGKKAETVQWVIPFTNIKTTKIQPQF